MTSAYLKIERSSKVFFFLFSMFVFSSWKVRIGFENESGWYWDPNPELHAGTGGQKVTK